MIAYPVEQSKSKQDQHKHVKQRISNEEYGAFLPNRNLDIVITYITIKFNIAAPPAVWLKPELN